MRLPAYGDTLPAQVATKNFNLPSENMPYAKGHDRAQKHIKNDKAMEDVLAGDGPEVEAAPGEEEIDQETLRNRRDQA
jgi:hypothetical protein